VVRPDRELFLGTFLELPDISCRPPRLKQGTPLPLLDILLGDEGKRSGVMTLWIGPPGWMKNLVGQVRVQRTGNAADAPGISIDELDQAPDIL